VALARLEEVAGKIATARRHIRKGCELCPHSIVVWEEAIRYVTSMYELEVRHKLTFVD
jgi:hypothetical protein